MLTTRDDEINIIRAELLPKKYKYKNISQRTKRQQHSEGIIMATAVDRGTVYLQENIKATVFHQDEVTGLSMSMF